VFAAVAGILLLSVSSIPPQSAPFCFANTSTQSREAAKNYKLIQGIGRMEVGVRAVA
jgi:hypothetical protein